MTDPAVTSASCIVCDLPVDAPAFKSARTTALTSLGESIPGTVTLHVCRNCGHAQGARLTEVAKFYGDDYHILTASAEEDDLYDVRDGKPVFRAAHQCTVLTSKLKLRPGAIVLDYGCAKAATLKLLAAARPDIQPHAFDVSDRYRDFWSAFIHQEAQATFDLPREWSCKFDTAISFFAFEHIENPHGALRDLARALKPGGTLYLIVPDAIANPADFIVIDHLNHYTVSSMTTLLQNSGFDLVEMDRASHRSAMIAIAQPSATIRSGWRPDAAVVQEVSRQISVECRRWAAIDQNLTSINTETRGRPCAIYGAGVYGRYIATGMEDMNRLTCFIDQNPYLQGKSVMGKKVVPPEQLPSMVKDVVVGLNPKVAKDIIGHVDTFAKRDLRFHYL